MADNSAYNPPDLSQTMANLGFKPVNPIELLNKITSYFGTGIQIVFAWIYFLAEIAVLIGVLVYLWGAIGHHSRIKQVGTRIVLYSVIAFIAAVILPGVIVAINNKFHG